MQCQRRWPTSSATLILSVYMNRLPLHHLHQQLGASFTGLADWEVPAAYKDAASEYRAATEDVALIDRSYLGRFRVQGKDALDLLNRLSSYKVDVLPEGTGAATVLPTNKGRVIDLLQLFATQDGLLMTYKPAHQAARGGVGGSLHLPGGGVARRRTTERTAMLTLHGPEVEGLLQSLINMDPTRLELYGSSQSVAKRRGRNTAQNRPPRFARLRHRRRRRQTPGVYGKRW